MKVLILGRPGLFNSMSGERIQIENTAEGIKKLGAEVEIKTDFNFDPKNYDIVHVFQLDWSPVVYFYVKKAFQAKTPVVLSPIHHNVAEVQKFDDTYVFDFRRISRVLFRDQFHRDVFKNIYRYLFNAEMLKMTLRGAFHGFKKTLAESLQMSDLVLVQTDLEAEDLKKTFSVTPTFVKIPNGVSANFLNYYDMDVKDENPFPFENYIICVGRIEPRKNQLSVIKAVDQLRQDLKQDIKLVLIGAISEGRHYEYTYLFKKLLREYTWITHISRVDYVKMPVYYKYAKVCASASWFETTGLTLLEALFCGTNGVAAGDRAKELLDGYVSYCLPDNIQSITEALKREYQRERPRMLEGFRKEFTWDNAAKKTLESYVGVLERRKK